MGGIVAARGTHFELFLGAPDFGRLSLSSGCILQRPDWISPYMLLPCVSLTFRNGGFIALDLTGAKAGGRPLVLGTSEVGALDVVRD